MRAELIQIDGVWNVKLHDEVNVKEFQKHAINGRYYAYVEPYIKGTTTDEQRKHWFALIKDIADYTGEHEAKINMQMKLSFMIVEDMDKEPSLARNKMKKEQTARLLQMVIDFCLERGIPLRQNYLPLMEQKQLFAMTMKRICWITHKPNADLCHFEHTVGMGRNRNKIDHTQSRFMTLSRELHQEQHTIGEESFCKKYGVQPIKLSADNLKELGVM